jgi:hypothetical protein
MHHLHIPSNEPTSSPGARARRATAALACAWALSALVACGDEENANADGGPSAGMACRGNGSLELNTIVTGGPAPAAAGRLVVFWLQFSDDEPSPPPKIVHDVPFTPGAAKVTIPLARLSPPDPVHLLCPRDCDDETSCPCLSDPKVGYGMVGVFEDRNGSGAIEPAEIWNSDVSEEDENLPSFRPLGIGRMALVCSEKSYPASHPDTGPLFPEGIRAGIHSYRLLRTDPESSFDRLGPPTAGQPLELQVCSSAAPGCTLEVPNLN